MRVTHIYHRNSPLNEDELELIFLEEEVDYILVFNRCDFFVVNISSDFTLDGFKEMNGVEKLRNDDGVKIEKIYQSLNYDTVYVCFRNEAILKIGFHFNNYLGKEIQGVQIFTKDDEGSYGRCFKEMGDFRTVRVGDMRYSSKATFTVF